MWAGERLRLAGCSSGRSVCARGGWSARRGWFRCGVYVRITPAVCRIAPNRTACAVFRSYSDVGRDRHECVLELSVRLSGWAGSLWGVRFFAAIPTGEQSRQRSVWGARISCGETLRVCRNVLCSDHAAVCRIEPNRTACAVFRSYSAGSRSTFVRSRGVGAVICLGGFTSGLCVSLWRSRRGYRDAGTRERGTGLAARLLCAFAQAHWLCCSFRREYAGAARPRLRQRVFDSLDSLHAAAGLRWYVFAAFVRFCAAALAL